jgi:hypothetical protein
MTTELTSLRIELSSSGYRAGQAPCAFDTDSGIRVVFSARDKLNRTQPFAVDLTKRDGHWVVSGQTGPLLELGEPGTFDDSGVMPSQVFMEGKKVYLLYVGWNQGQPARYRTSIGVAISYDGGRSFQKCPGPTLDRTPQEPIGVSMPYLVRMDEQLRLYYMSYQSWSLIEGQFEPIYTLRQALVDSADLAGIRELRDVFTPVSQSRALARPVVYWSQDRWKMIFCERAVGNYRQGGDGAYRFGVAESLDQGKTWRPTSAEQAFGQDLMRVVRSLVGTSDKMLAYPYMHVRSDSSLFFFNTDFVSPIHAVVGVRA